MPEQPRTPRKRAAPTPVAPAVEELKAEVDELRAKLDRKGAWNRRRRRLRRIGAGALVVLFAVAAVSTTIGTWARTTLLDTDKFVDTVAPVTRDPEVDAALAAFLTTELFVAFDVEQLAEDALPDEVEFLAVILTNAVEDFTRQRVETFLEAGRFRGVWRDAVRRAHEVALRVLRDESDVVVNRDGSQVVLNLLPVINEILQEVAAELPEVFGQQLAIPDVTDETTQAEIRDAIESAFGVELPEDFGQIPVFNENRLSEAQDALHLADRFLVVLVALTLISAGGALALSVDRRRTVLQLGLGVVVATYLVFTILRRVIADLIDLIPAGQNRDAVHAAARIVAEGLRDRAWFVLIAGLVVAIGMYLAGPGRGARWVRSLAATAVGRVRERAVATPASPAGHWVHANLDAMRIGGLVVAALWLILANVSWLGLFVAVVLLIGYEIAVTAVAQRATPEAAP